VTGRLIAAAATCLLVVQAGVAQTPGPEALLLTFAGDVMQHDRNLSMKEFDRIYDAVRPYLTADDLSFANIEFPVDPGRPAAGYPIFNGSVEYVEAAIRGGFDVFSLANNHSFDLGSAGAMATRSEFSVLAAENGIAFNGIRSARDEPADITAIEINGHRIGFVAITAFSNVNGSLPYIHLVDYTDPRAARDFLDQVSAWDRQFELLVISVHGGVEYSASPDAAKATFFRDLVAHGADIVWGHHPHVVQAYETIRWGGATKLILHSTGNFISAQRRLQQPFLPVGRWAPTGDLALFQVAVDLSGASADVSIAATPVFSVVDDPEHGLIPRTFGSLFTGEMPLEWRSFYLARYAAMRRVLDNPVRGFAVRGLPAG